MNDERALQTAVIALAKTLGYRCAHFRPGMMRSGAWVTAMSGASGWPDLCVVGRGRILYRELKTDKGRLSDEQVAWGDAIGMAGGDWAVWRISDWPDRIQRELGG